jgi:hypothetical protein
MSNQQVAPETKAAMPDGEVSLENIEAWTRFPDWS